MLHTIRRLPFVLAQTDMRYRMASNGGVRESTVEVSRVRVTPKSGSVILTVHLAGLFQSWVQAVK